MPVDFTRIDPEEFELLCEDLLQAMGFIIEAKVARGPDLGKDIIAAHTMTDPAGFVETRRYLIECKHYAASGKSVQERDIGSPIARMGTHQCDRYILITSTVPSEKVRAQLSGLPNAVSHFAAITWSKGDLTRLLDEHPDVCKRYFPSKAVPAAAGLAEIVKDLLTAMGFDCQAQETTGNYVRLACTSDRAFPRPAIVVCKADLVDRRDVEALLTEVETQNMSSGVLVTYVHVLPAARERAAETRGAVQVFRLDQFYRYATTAAVVGPDKLEKARLALKHLRSLQTGQQYAAAYEEDVCLVLSTAFHPYLTNPRLQAKTIGGGRRRDILFSNFSSHPFWQRVSQRHDATLIVFEVKNVKRLAVRYVDQVAGYLTPGVGRLGFIVGRTQVRSPIIQRAVDVFRAERKVVLFLCDDDLEHMLKHREMGEDPTDLIRQRYDEFIALT